MTNRNYLYKERKPIKMDNIVHITCPFRNSLFFIAADADERITNLCLNNICIFLLHFMCRQSTDVAHIHFPWMNECTDQILRIILESNPYKTCKTVSQCGCIQIMYVCVCVYMYMWLIIHMRFENYATITAIYKKKNE